jgi:hypothetical protein
VSTVSPVSPEPTLEVGTSGDQSNQSNKRYLLDSPRSVASSCCSSMLSTSPQKPQTKADIFFYNELGLTLGQVSAEHWLATESSTCSRSGEASCKPNNRSRRPDDTLCDRSHECDIARLISSHGEKAGLLFTDAAHELLDSPRSEASHFSSRSENSSSRGQTCIAKKETDNTTIRAPISSRSVCD